MNIFSLCQADLTPKDMERARFAFDIYDFEGKARMDLFYLGDVLRGLNLNPTLKMIEKLGGTKKKGEKFLKLEEVSLCKINKYHIMYFTGKCIKKSIYEINKFVLNSLNFSFTPSTKR